MFLKDHKEIFRKQESVASSTYYSDRFKRLQLFLRHINSEGITVSENRTVGASVVYDNENLFHLLTSLANISDSGIKATGHPNLSFPDQYLCPPTC